MPPFLKFLNGFKLASSFKSIGFAVLVGIAIGSFSTHKIESAFRARDTAAELAKEAEVQQRIILAEKARREATEASERRIVTALVEQVRKVQRESNETLRQIEERIPDNFDCNIDLDIVRLLNSAIETANGNSSNGMPKATGDSSSDATGTSTIGVQELTTQLIRVTEIYGEERARYISLINWINENYPTVTEEYAKSKNTKIE